MPIGLILKILDFCHGLMHGVAGELSSGRVLKQSSELEQEHHGLHRKMQSA